MSKLSKHILKCIFGILLIGILFFFIIDSKTSTLTVIHTNDLHSHLLAIDDNLQDCYEGKDCIGGFAKLQNFIEEERVKDPHLILLDAGDRFSGTYFFTLHKELDLIPIFQKLKYDAFTLGNHEFDNELSILENFLKNVITPTICTNIIINKNDFLKKHILPFKIIKKKGINIGIIGALTEDTPHSAMHGNDIQFKNLKDALTTEIQHLEDQGAHFIILLSHLGLEKDKEIAQLIPKIDLIVGGHSHNLLSNTEKASGPYPIEIQHTGHDKTLIVTSGAFGRFVGKLILKVNTKGQITFFQGNTIPLNEKIQNDPETQNYIHHKEKEISYILNQPITTLKKSIPLSENKDYCGKNCPVGKFITESILKNIPNIDLVLLNSGAIRAGLPEGQVQYKHLLQMLPFDSSLVVVKMKGSELISYLEKGLEHYQKNSRVNAFLHIGGGNYWFDEQSKKVTSLTVQNQPLQLEKIYHIAIPLFLAKGGDNFPVQKDLQNIPKDMIQLISKSF